MDSRDLNIKINDSTERKRVKKIRIALSLSIAMVGGLLLSLQLVPLANSYLNGQVFQIKNSNIKSPIPGAIKTELNGEFAFWDPSASYFQNLLKNAGDVAGVSTKTYDPSTNSYKTVVVDTSYNGKLNLSIPSLGIAKINVAPNTESYDEKVYNRVLKNGLAHFQGTPVCGDGGNCFIYGHSAVETYFQRHQNNPETIFTRLEDIEIGDMVEIDRDGTLLKYKVRRIRVTDPSDFSVLQTIGDKETLTMMTCTPIGIGTHRLIVIADRYE
jgi:LPXTG-site transpeptidase (sortase) family protein